jgi:hypothetical protein
MEYLGRYTHKIALSNYLIKELSGITVGLTFLDRTDDNKQKYNVLTGVQFFRRFLCHIVLYHFTLFALLCIPGIWFLLQRNR